MTDVLISAEALIQRLERGDPPTLLDVRWVLGGPSAHEDYLAGHIPGAVFIDLDRDLSAPPGPGGRHPLPEPAAFGAVMRRAGVSPTREVIVYASGAPGPAARAWWLLRYFGHPSVRVLDGGIDAFVAAGGALHAGEAPAPGPAPGDFQPQPGGLPLLDSAAAGELATRGVLLDARTPERFRGESEPIDPVAGHIPGARNLPAGATVTADGRLREPHAVRAAVRAAAEGRPADVSAGIGAYCGSGVTAAHVVLALAHAGLPASLYVGSWSEWITDPDRPVAPGA